MLLDHGNRDCFRHRATFLSRDQRSAFGVGSFKGSV